MADASEEQAPAVAEVKEEGAPAVVGGGGALTADDAQEDAAAADPLHATESAEPVQAGDVAGAAPATYFHALLIAASVSTFSPSNNIFSFHCRIQ
jgi:hypothetical protein